MTPRSLALPTLSVLLLAAAAAWSPAAAQTVPQSAVVHAGATDTTPAARATQVLAPVEVKAESRPADRKTYSAKVREVRALNWVRSDYDRQIGRLEQHLDSLKTVVAPAMERQVAQMDSTTLAIRAQREALEARLRAIQERQAAQAAQAAQQAQGGQQGQTSPTGTPR